MCICLGAELYIVRHQHIAEDDSQLGLSTGRIVEVIEKNDNGWWRGTIEDQEGWFPSSFVQKLDGRYGSSEIGTVWRCVD